MKEEYPININKFISHSGLCSRREADRLIKAGNVTINDQTAQPIDKVNKNDKVMVGSKEVPHNLPKTVYLAYNKPVGVITTTDQKAKDNIIEKVNYPERVFPIGRLDVKTSGLILLTNDGSIVNSILKGQEKIEKEYIVDVDKTVTDDFLQQLERGIFIEGHRTLPAKAEKLGDRKFSLTIVEGKKRQVRRMCEKLGYNVLHLVRIRIGKITVENIKEGSYIELTRDQIKENLGV